MKASIDHLLYLIKENGVEKSLDMIDIESIEDHTIKVICRTIKYSSEELEKVLIDRIYDRNKKALKGVESPSQPLPPPPPLDAA
jgi:hypothetical protein